MSLPLIITGCISASHHHWLYLCLSSSLSMSSRVKNPRYKELEEKAATGAYGSRVTRGVDDCKPFNCRQHALLPHACAITHLLTCSCSQVCEAAAQKRAAECAEAAEGGKGKCEAPAEALSSSDKSSANEAAVRTNAHWDHYAGTTLLLIAANFSTPSALTARTLFSIHLTRTTSFVYLCQHHCQNVRFFQTSSTKCQSTPIRMFITKSVQKISDLINSAPVGFSCK